MLALAHIVENDSRVLITGHGKTDAIGTCTSRHSHTAASVAQVAKVVQLFI